MSDENGRGAMLGLAQRWGRLGALTLLGIFTLGLMAVAVIDVVSTRRLTAMVNSINISPMLPMHVPGRHQRLADPNAVPIVPKAQARDEGFGAYDPKHLTRRWVVNPS